MASQDAAADPAAPLVRRATPDDLDAIVDIYLASARHHAALEPRTYRVPAIEDVRERFGRMLAESDPEDAHFVAEVDGRVVGAADAFRGAAGGPGSMRRPTRRAEVGIGVLDGWRGRGVGRALIAAAEAWARDEGLEILVLEVAAENEGASRLYDRLGYRPVSHELAKLIREE